MASGRRGPTQPLTTVDSSALRVTRAAEKVAGAVGHRAGLPCAGGNTQGEEAGKRGHDDDPGLRFVSVRWCSLPSSHAWSDDRRSGPIQLQ